MTERKRLFDRADAVRNVYGVERYNALSLADRVKLLRDIAALWTEPEWQMVNFDVLCEEHARRLGPSCELAVYVNSLPNKG